MIPRVSKSEWSPQWVSVDGSVTDTPPPRRRKHLRKSAEETKKVASVLRDTFSSGEKKIHNNDNNRKVSFNKNVKLRHIPSYTEMSRRRIAATYYLRDEYKEIKQRRLEEAAMFSDLQEDAHSKGVALHLDIDENDICIRGIEYEVYEEFRCGKVDRRWAAQKAVLDEQAYQNSIGIRDGKFIADAYSKHSKDATERAVLLAHQDAVIAKRLNVGFSMETMDTCR